MATWVKIKRWRWPWKRNAPLCAFCAGEGTLATAPGKRVKCRYCKGRGYQ